VTLTIVGVDPGARWTGVIARRGRDLLHGVVVENTAGDRVPYAVAVCAEIRNGIEISGGNAVVAVEDVRAPCPHVNRRNGRALTNPGPIIETGVLLGWVLATFEDVVVVPPGGHGSNPLISYPGALVTASEHAHMVRAKAQLKPAPQNSTRRHLRSAWDIAGTLTRVGRTHLTRRTQ